MTSQPHVAHPHDNEFIGSIDQGTTSTRVILFDRRGVPRFHEQVPSKSHSPSPGWLEQDPLDIYKAVVDCIEGVVKKAKESLGEVKIKAIGITNQRETTILWDKQTGKPFYNAIIWSDGRTKDTCSKLVTEFGDKYHFEPICGLPISTYFSAIKARWLLDNHPEIKAAAAEGRCLFGTVDSWLIWNLSGRQAHVTDVTNASRTMLMCLKDLSWHEETCRKLQIPTTMLPKILSSSENFCTIAEGSLKGIPVTGCLGDQQAALLGQRCVREGDIKNTYGTGCFMLLNTGNRPVYSKQGLLTTVAYKLGAAPASYAIEGSVAVAGSSIEWLKNNLGIISSPEEVATLASSVSDCGGVYFVPAFSGLFAPYWRDDARGCIVGITQYTTKAHIARATLEAIALQNTELLEAMIKESHLSISKIHVDGGLTKSDFLLRLQADFFGLPVVKPPDPESTALGAAFAAGLAVGFYHEAEIFTEPIASHVFSPHLSIDQREKKLNEWKKAVTRSFDWA